MRLNTKIANWKIIAANILRARFSQIIVNEKYRAGEFKVPIHLALGHETIAVALSEILGRNDKLLLTHRNIAYHLALGASVEQLIAEYLLKKDGLAGGRFGSMNLINSNSVIYTSSILGNQFPIAVGVSAGEMRRTKKYRGITVVLGGDGSMEEGSFYESLLMSRSVGAPVIFIIENNEWSMHTNIKERRTPINLKLFSESLGVAYECLEGNNPFEYIDKLKSIRKSVLETNVATCLEVKVTTLGDWRGPKIPEYPQGKFINYHAGPTPVANLSEWPVLKESKDDPVFVLSELFGEKEIRMLAQKEFKMLNKDR